MRNYAGLLGWVVCVILEEVKLLGIRNEEL